MRTSRTSRSSLTALLAVSLVASALFAAPSAAQETAPDIVIESAPGVLIAEPANDSMDVTSGDAQEYFAELQDALPIDPEAREATPSLAGSTASAVSGFSVDYNSTYPAPASVRSVINSVVANWNSVVATGLGPVEIEFYWQCLDPGLLGLAGPVGFYRHSSLPTTDWYPAPLANTLLGYDVNDSYEGEPLPEIQVILNASLASGNSCGTPGGTWYIGSNGNPSGGQIDLYSVALHEIGHGLGFLSSGSNWDPENEIQVPQALESPYPFVFDRQLLYNGSSLINLANRDSLLTSQNIKISAGTSWSYDVYAPASWSQGSSLSHFDEAASAPGLPGALMTPALGNGQAERLVDAPTAGVMQRIGWPMKVKAVSPANLTASVSGSAVSATWDIPMTAQGLPPTGHVVQLFSDGTLVGTTNVGGTAESVLVNGFSAGKNHTLRVTPTGPGGNGAAASLSSASPATLNASGTKTNRTITWPAAAASAPVSNYTLQQQTDGGSWSTVSSPIGRSVTMADLPSGSIVQFRVRANTSLGTSQWTYSTLIGISNGVVRPFPLDGQVGRLYLAYFQRDADAAGFKHWLTQRANGMGVNAISAAFADSAEFQQTYGSLTNSQFVDLIYRNVLGREADAEGRDFWTNALNKGLSRGQVMVQFADSQEFVNQTGTVPVQLSTEGEIYRLYVAFFLRYPDAGGMDFWVDLRTAGTSLDAISAEFVNSDEFQARYGSLSNADFVELVYQNVLSRSPDAAGRDYWTSLLDGGRSRGSVMTGFSESVEFILLTGSMP